VAAPGVTSALAAAGDKQEQPKVFSIKMLILFSISTICIVYYLLDRD
jgi:hypothetical protein